MVVPYFFEQRSGKVHGLCEQRVDYIEPTGIAGMRLTENGCPFPLPSSLFPLQNKKNGPAKIERPPWLSGRGIYAYAGGPPPLTRAEMSRRKRIWKRSWDINVKCLVSVRDARELFANVFVGLALVKRSKLSATLVLPPRESRDL